MERDTSEAFWMTNKKEHLHTLRKKGSLGSIYEASGSLLNSKEPFNA